MALSLREQKLLTGLGAVAALGMGVMVLRNRAEWDEAQVPFIEGGAIVWSGWGYTAGDVKVYFQIEEVAGDQSPNGAFYGVIKEPWTNDNPVIVAQAPTKDDARIATQTLIKADTHGLPGP